MNADELNDIVNRLLSSEKFTEWRKSFPFDAGDLQGSDVERAMIARLLAFAISVDIEIKTLELMIPKR
jgi:hypothetical protein